jgi:hypothetical protein
MTVIDIHAWRNDAAPADDGRFWRWSEIFSDEHMVVQPALSSSRTRAGERCHDTASDPLSLFWRNASQILAQSLLIGGLTLKTVTLHNVVQSFHEFDGFVVGSYIDRSALSSHIDNSVSWHPLAISRTGPGFTCHGGDPKKL